MVNVGEARLEEPTADSAALTQIRKVAIILISPEKRIAGHTTFKHVFQRQLAYKRRCRGLASRLLRDEKASFFGIWDWGGYGAVSSVVPKCLRNVLLSLQPRSMQKRPEHLHHRCGAMCT